MDIDTSNPNLCHEVPVYSNSRYLKISCSHVTGSGVPSKYSLHSACNSGTSKLQIKDISSSLQWTVALAPIPVTTKGHLSVKDTIPVCYLEAALYSNVQLWSYSSDDTNA